MTNRSHLFDDVMRMANGAAASVSALRDEAEARMRDYLAQTVEGMDLVRREEFEAVRDMAVRARAENERLAARIEELETRLASLAGVEKAAKPRRRKSTAKRAPKPAADRTD